MPEASQSTPLHRLLMSIPKHSGPDGFEGLIAHLLSSFTGLRFHLSKSGDQRGVDGATYVGIRIGMEAKHYGPSEIRRKEVVGGCAQALLANRDRPLDLWVLACTTHADAQLCQELNQLCGDYHCSVLTLDYDPEKSLHLLEVLCACQKAALKSFVDRVIPTQWNPNVDDWLIGMAANPDYQASLDFLTRQLLEPTIGYDAWVRAIKREVHETLTDPVRCRRFLGFSHSDLLPPLSTSVRRRALESKLSDWWASSARHPLVILGDEGTGKSWGCLYWLVNVFRPDGPPVVPIPSRLRTRSGLIDCVANICVALFNGYSESDWKRRLTRWARGNRFWCLPYLDGLLERETGESLTELLAEDSTAVLATCRAEPWKRLSSWRNREPFWDDSFTVLGLDDNEFRELSLLRGIDCCQFSLDTQSLMRKPRYFDLAVRVRADISDDYLVTPDLLLALDWEDRIARSDILQQRTGMDREGFRLGIQRLCLEYHGKVDPSAIREAFGVWGDPGELGQILSDEDIFQRDKLTGKWIVNPYYLILGVGLALAEQVATMASECDFESEISRLLEPAPDMDRKAQACGIACSATWRTLGVDSPKFASILRVWLGMPNADVNEQHQLLSKIPNDAVRLQPVIEGAWEKTGSSKEQELLLEQLYGLPIGSYRTEVTWISLIDAWIGIYLESGFPTTSWLRIGREEVVQQISNYSLEFNTGRPWLQYLRKFSNANHSLLRLRFIALDLIHRLPDKRRFAERLVAWLVASSLNQAWQDEGYFIWVVETHFDELWPELVRVSALLSDSCPVEKRARQMLESFIDTQEAGRAHQGRTVRFGTFFEDVLNPSYEVARDDDELQSRIQGLLDRRPYSFSDFEDWFSYGAARDLDLCHKLITNLLMDVLDQDFDAQFKRLLSLEDFTEFLSEADSESLHALLARVLSEESSLQPRRAWAESLLSKFAFVTAENPSIWQAQKVRPEWQVGYGHLVLGPGSDVESEAYLPLLENAESPGAAVMNSLRYLNWFPHRAPEAVATALERLATSPKEQTRLAALRALLSVHPEAPDFARRALMPGECRWNTWEEKPLLASLILRDPASFSASVLFEHCPREILLAAVKLRGPRAEELKKVAQIYRELSAADFPGLDIRRGEIRAYNNYSQHICYPIVDEPSQASPHGVSKRDFREWWGGSRPELEPLTEPAGRVILGSADSAEFERRWRGFQDARENSVRLGNPWLGSFWDGKELSVLFEAEPGLLEFWLRQYRDDPGYLRRFPQLYESIFEHLLKHDPVEALKLFKALVATPTLLTIDGRTDLPRMVHTFWKHWESMPSSVWDELWNGPAWPDMVFLGTRRIGCYGKQTNVYQGVQGASGSTLACVEQASVRSRERTRDI